MMSNFIAPAHMSTSPVRILAFAGATRTQSWNKKLIRLGADAVRREGAEVTLIDLRDVAMPLFDGDLEQEGLPPGAQVLKGLMVEHDGFLISAPEYNSSISAVLKNAIDWVYPEWRRKAACFVSYGSAMGVRSVQQLRQNAIELQLAPIRSSVHIPVATLWAHYQGGDVDAGLAELEAAAGVMIDDLLWWTAALKAARAGVT
jgi:NAD(P)H-dependent FMN reductase